MARNQFIDAATGDAYTWEVNHREVPSLVRSRSIEVEQPTAAGWEHVAPILTQGPEAHQLHRIEGLVANRAQHEAFLNFWRISAERTVHFLPCTGGRYEVVVRSYAPTRKSVVSGPRGAKLHVWNYELTMEIVAQLA
jgi:hypothetical protein